jgi:hypothetical protein
MEVYDFGSDWRLGIRTLLLACLWWWRNAEE